MNSRSAPARALIFDFDGLILDTEVPEFEAWQDVYRMHDCHLSFETWSACIGTSEPVFNPCEHLEAQLGQAINRDDVRAAHRERFGELVAAQSVLPGVREYLVDARRLGLKVGVASSSTREWVEGHLLRLGLLSCFDGIRCKDDVRRTKPDPELYTATLRTLGVPANEGIAMEDSPNGILAAKRAGLFCVAVPNALTRQLYLGEADLQLGSLADLPLEELLELHSAPDKGS